MGKLSFAEAELNYVSMVGAAQPKDKHQADRCLEAIFHI